MDFFLKIIQRKHGHYSKVKQKKTTLGELCNSFNLKHTAA